MSDFPKELIAVCVTLWMNLHTANRRGLLYSAEVNFRSDVGEGISIFINENGLMNWTWWRSGYQGQCYVSELMPSSPGGVGIADYEAHP
jgi:hypothetical protein